MDRTSAQIQIETRSNVPAYRQIADQLRVFIVEGLLESGVTLPPVRRLALDLGIHFNTVAEAYRTLAGENFVEITHGHGARVIDRATPRHPGPEATGDFRRKLRELVAAVRASGVSSRQIAAELTLISQSLENR